MTGPMHDLLNDDNGATIIEYGLILALVSAAATALSGTVEEVYNALAETLQCSASDAPIACAS